MRTLRTIFLFLSLTSLFTFAGCHKKEDAAAFSLRKEKAITEQLLLANQYLKTDQQEKGLQLLEDLQKANSNHVGILEALGFAYSEIKDHSLAAFYFEQVVRLDPSLYDHILYAAQAHCDAGEWSAAANNYKLFLQIFPTDDASWKNLAHTLKEDNQPKIALKAYLKAFQLNPSPPKIEESIEIGQLFLSINDRAKAKAWFQSALESDPTNLTALTTLTQLEFSEDNLTITEKYLNTLASAHPTAIQDSQALSSINQTIIEHNQAQQLKEQEAILRAQQEAYRQSRHRSHKRKLANKNIEKSQELISSITAKNEVAKSNEFEHNSLNLLNDFLSESESDTVANATD